MSIVSAVSPTVNTSVPALTPMAFRFGAEDAVAGKPCVPEMVFIGRADQIEYAKGFESITGPTFATVQFTGSTVPAPIIVPNLKVNDRERVRRTDSNVERIFQASAAQAKRLARMAEETAAFLGYDDGEIIFA